MKRRALLIGNTNGLPGVKVDIDAIGVFLESRKGGAWNSVEISTIFDPTKAALTAMISAIKQQKNDFVVVHFSGHGGQERQTILEINSKGECIPESDLFGLATRQVSIFDCCRAYPEALSKNASLESDSTIAFAMESLDATRERYDARQMQAIPQQVQMYACSKGQSALDTPDGGIYTSSILRAASASGGSNGFKTLGEIHQQAIPRVLDFAKSKGSKQVPEIVIPRCLASQQLILAINA